VLFDRAEALPDNEAFISRAATEPRPPEARPFTIEVSDLTTGATLATLATPGRFGRKTGVAFSPDGRRLITVTAPGAETVSYLAQRDISDAALFRSACATAGRDLTAAEWRSFVGTAPPADLTCR
jgi:hypothetical protein